MVVPPIVHCFFDYGCFYVPGVDLYKDIYFCYMILEMFYHAFIFLDAFYVLI